MSAGFPGALRACRAKMTGSVSSGSRIAASSTDGGQCFFQILSTGPPARWDRESGTSPRSETTGADPELQAFDCEDSIAASRSDESLPFQIQALSPAGSPGGCGSAE